MVERIDSLTNKKIKDTAALHNRRQRAKQGRFVAEGLRLGEMAAASDWPLCYAFYTAELATQPRGAALLKQLMAKDCPCYETSPAAFAKAAATQSPQGILIVMEQRPVSLTDLAQVDKACRAGVPDQETQAPFFVVLDGLQDPGNVGTIIRTADAAGATGMILTKGSVDIYDDKTVRATMGSLFHLPVVTGVSVAELIAFAHELDLQLFATALDAAAQPHFTCDFQRGTAIAFGNEGNGVSEALLAAAQKVYIPMYGQAESLNAATSAAAILYEMVRQRYYKLS